MSPSMLMIGFALRFVFFIFFCFQSSWVSTDFLQETLPVARHLLSGEGFTADGMTPWAWKGPVYPLLTALFIFLFGDSVFTLRLFLVMLDGLCIPLIYKLGVAGFGPRPAKIAAWIWTFYLPSIWLAALLNYEVLATFFLILALVIFLTLGRNSRLFSGLAGGVLALAILSRASLIWLGPFLVLWGLLLREIRKEWFAPLILFALFSLAGVLPWSIRNYQNFHAVIPVSIAGSSALFSGSERAFITETETRKELSRKRLESLGFSQPLGSVPEQENVLRQAVWRNYRRQWNDNPGEILALYLTKAYQIFFVMDSSRWQWALGLVNIPLVIFAMIGVFSVGRLGSILPPAFLILGTLIYVWLIHLPFLPFFRFILPAFPLFLLFAGRGINVLISQDSRRGNPIF